ncbi:hypothetical protein H6776_00600 [Candidatus Nomurabacteria bacterium]|nr:hypothetical protein [Candidatus Nomurabacteria bacterium]
MKKTNIGNVPKDKVLGTFKDFCEKLESGAISWESWQVFRNLLKNQHALLGESKNPFTIPTNLEVWQTIYQEHFGIEIDISDIEDKPNRWPIYVHKGTKTQHVYELLETLFPCWKNTRYKYRDLDDVVTHNDRETTESYVIWVAQNVEADEQFANKSADTLRDENHKGMTLLERLLLELFYYTLTGKHLDIGDFTLCTGSRNIGGSVPCVGWGWGGEMKVNSFSPSDADACMRSRKVVSVQKLTT